jgi:glycosyltransferase involved in cell wall biosynthesis
MRVLLVHNFYQIAGGEDSVVREELSMLKRKRVEVELHSVSNNDIRGARGAMLAALRVVYSPRARRQLSERLAEFLPDVVHIHNFFPLLSPSILDACRDAGVPSIMTLHNFRILSPGGLLHPDEMARHRNPRHSCWWTVPKRVYRNSAAATLAVAAMIEFHKWAGTWTRKVDRFIALTDWAKRMFTDAGLPAERIIVKPNCVARPPAFDEVRRNGALFVGRLCKQKGIDLILQAWKDIDYPLRIIGDGPLSELVTANASHRVVYLGRLPREAVQKEMHAAKFLLLPSRGYEMFPMSVVEAFASGLPVICSDLPTLKELVKQGANGLTFPPGNANGLAAQVRWAVSNPATLDDLSRRARACYEERYTPEVNFDRLMGLYRSLARRAHSAKNEPDSSGLNHYVSSA